MKGRENFNMNSLHIMTIIISFFPGAGYTLNVMKTAKQFNKVQDFAALQVREWLKEMGGEGNHFFPLKDKKEEQLKMA